MYSKTVNWAVVVSQIQSLANCHIEHLLNVNCIEKTKIKKKRLEMGHLENLLIDSKCSIFVLSHLDFLDFLQKKSYSIDHQSNISSENLRRDMAII